MKISNSPPPKLRGLSSLFQMLLLMLCINFSAFAAPPPSPITITGVDSACVGDRKTYTIIPTGGLVYKWSSNTKGFIYSTTSSTGTVQWGLPGVGVVYAYGIDLSTGDTLELGSFNVNVYALPTTYLTASSLMGCQMVGTKDTTEQPGPPGMITSKSGCINTCENSTVTYYAHDKPGSTYTWLVSGAVSYVDMGDSCIVTWGAPGSGTVSVTTTNIHGCMSTLNICIKVIEGPKAIFTTFADSTYNDNSTSETVHICAGGKVQFLDISTSLLTSPIVSCIWDFGDGTFRTTGGPTSFSHKYTTMGTYIARLVVKNSCGCTDTARVTVEVGPCEDVGIECPSVVCENASGTYKLNPAVACTPYAWTAKGGTITSPPFAPFVTVKWDNVDESGFGYIIFDGAGCPPPTTGKTVIKVPVIKSVGKIKGPSVLCVNSQGLYSMPEWPTTDFNWTIVSPAGSFLSYTDQRNQAVINTTNSTETIILKVTYKNTLTGCGGYAYDTIKVEAPSTIIGPVKFCLRDIGNWHLSGAAVGDWRLVYPDGTDVTASSVPTFIAPLIQVGSYTLSVSGLTCVPDPIRFTIKEKPGIPASISGIDSPCADVPYTYVAGGIGEGSTFGWAVSSGTVAPATGDSTKITFTGVGPYTIKTWRISGIAPYCTSDTLFTVVDNPHPHPVITGPITVCGSSTSSYVVDYKKGETYDYVIIPPTAGSVSAGGTGTTPTITWNNPPAGGTISATLRVSLRKCATIYTGDLNVTIVGTPTITLTPTPDTICSGSPVTLTISSSPSIGTFASVDWTFGDGTSLMGGTSLTTTHVYTNTGTTKSNFAPSVVVTDINGCIGSFAKAATNIWVRPLSVANATPVGPTSMCTPTWTTNLYASISSGPPTTAFFEWFKVGVVGSVLSGPTASTLTVDKLGPGLGLSYGDYYCVVTNSDGCTDATNIVSIDSNCGGSGGCSGRTVTFTTGVIDCGRIRVDATVAGGTILYSEWETAPDAYDLDPSLTTFKASYPVSGMYDVKYRIFFLVGADTCVIEFDTSVIVPFRAALRYSIVCTGGAYDVTVFDNSDYFPTTMPTYYEYNIVKSGTTYTGIGGPSFTKTGLTPGTVYLSHLIRRVGYPDCIVYDTIVLPVLPSVVIIPTGPNPACANDGLLNLFAHCIPGTGPATFHWDFGDFSESDLNPVAKTYAGFGTYPINVTATNEYGCTSITTYNHSVVTHNLNGDVTHLPMSPCEGEVVTLIYTPAALTTTPTSYDWYKETVYLSSSVVNTKTITNAGGYWAFVRDIYGCKFATAVHPVHYVEVPEGKITGEHDQCINVSYTLDGGAPADVIGGTHHEWLRDGVLISTFGNTITELFTIPGVHTYYLITATFNPGTGTFCKDTSDAFVVTVHGATAPPVVSFNILDCADYTVELNASSPFAGTFNWSHGATGTPALAYSGGTYRVYLTDIYGCPSHSDVYVPKSPQEFLWIFPTGCYKLCIEGAPYTLLGPSGSFYHYDWMKNGISDVGGSGIVPDYSVITPGTYNLSLANLYCTNVSEDMDVSFVPCPPVCGNDVIFDILGTTHTTSPLCRDYINMNLWDMSGPPPGRPFSISAKHGILIASGGTLPVPPTMSTFRYIADPGFSGLTDTLTLRVTMPDGSICLITRFVTFSTTPCANSLAKMTQEKEEETIVTSELAKLLLSPNPAQNNVRVDYSFTGKSTQRFVEVYDLTGKLMSRTAVQDATGSVMLRLEQLSSGLYQVILRQDNEVFLRSKLAVTH